MQLPKKPHSPQSYKKKPISKESQRVNKSTSQQVNKTTSQQVNKTTSQRVNEKSNYRDFERAEAIVLTSLTP